MSHLKYFAYADHGVRLRELLHYSQAVRVGDCIECSGQCTSFPKVDEPRLTTSGGWDPKTGDVPKDLSQELENIFTNIDLNLRDAGGKGWDQVFKVRLYTTVLDEENVGKFIALLRQWTPNHTPILTAVVVAGLSAPTLHFEVEVEAHDPEEAVESN
ncbi:endoribonuclease L-PSP [Plectosphaerella plurivora]|uniref:Endoribonuclease L-PSP n=1 Tax=Plectosphaerella plurivora TaxID=936078 RepID=A0A9P8VJ75_9PEZI|nr:endoribonuclease L-PSP [Plectosphaerella plurivora]